MLKLFFFVALIFGPTFSAPESSELILQNEVVRCQNNWRSHIARRGHIKGRNQTAANMRELKYDLELETLAKQFSSNKPLILSKKDRLNGFTLFHATGFLNPSALAKADCENRYSQSYLSKWSPSNLTEPFFNFTGNWFQMIWAKSSRIGCASQFYSKNQEHRTILVCKYDVPMEVGKEIFEAGKSCAFCGKMNTRCDNLRKLCISG